MTLQKLTKFGLAVLILGVIPMIAGAEVGTHTDIVVAKDGSGDYTTITEAVDALSMYPYQRTVIYIKNGVYNEKLRINQNYITLRGESRDSTIIRYSQLRSDWQENKDYIGPGVINIHGDDIVLENLTIENSQPQMGEHAFTIYGDGNRIITNNCNIISKGGDTLALWNYKRGMYYHANSYIEGGVDFVCPRGWAFIGDSEFYEVRNTAAIWHAGNFDPNQKLVIKNSSFDGAEEFELGRHHYSAQFYLINCQFPEVMKDKPIYRVTYEDPSRNNPYYQGDRKYYYNCTKPGEEYSWYQNNLHEAPGDLSPSDITAEWTFDGKWNPESEQPVEVIGYEIDGKNLILEFSDLVTVRGEPAFENSSGQKFSIKMQRFNDINKLTFTTNSDISERVLTGKMRLIDGDIIASRAYVNIRSLRDMFQIID
ncbi:MAG: hypothetical protein K9N46_11495 [Candidatus Marinimicrobia bacterium]|nr:hypothetical protein [Candidatus Neomarinimicrobiota bacterium]MCF7827415.1 hypothetical protein [Candidatus Neomarinimicrobiota bacterium]MCF7881352.1 hypothetical protein [Candidatus Neomarinimicrobiota bacterium]